MKPFDRVFLFCCQVAAVFLLGVVIASCAGMLPAAPAPLPRRPCPMTLPNGLYELHWGGCLYQMTLTDGNGYRASGAGTWEGTATWDGASRTLVIVERVAGSSGDWQRYEVALDESLEGRTTCGVRVRLRRIR